jgi:hypothetical protein
LRCLRPSLNPFAQSYSSDSDGSYASSSSQAAQLKNQQDVRSSEAALAAGFKSVENLILRAGLLAVRGEMKKKVSYALDKAEKTLDACAAACEAPAATCLNQENVTTDSLDESSCRMTRALCRATCVQDFATTISNFPDPTANLKPLEQQQVMAKIGLMLAESDGVMSALRVGTTDLLRPALAEGFRISLDNYAYYGIPPGETTVQGGATGVENCVQQRSQETVTCIRSGDPNNFWSYFGHTLVCVAVDTVAAAGCGFDVLKRYSVR